MTRALPIVIAVALAVYAVIDCTQADRTKITSLPRPAWFAIILLVPIVGPILWLTVGRPRRQRAPRRPAPRPPVAPDDDPEFLRQLRDSDGKHEKMLRDWESELRRREDELRQNGDGDDDPRP